MIPGLQPNKKNKSDLNTRFIQEEEKWEMWEKWEKCTF